MIEFRYSTLLTDSFNPKEYDFYISFIGDNSLKISLDVIRQLGEKSFNLSTTSLRDGWSNNIQKSIILVL